MSKARVFVIGLDALDADLVAEWAEAGHLPTFRKLRQGTLTGGIENPLLLESGSCWQAFETGMSPAKTGLYDSNRYFNSQTYREDAYTYDDRLAPALWEQLSRAGKSCAVIDAPYMMPARVLNGIQIVDRSPHVPAGSGNMMRFSTQPPELRDEITELFGADPGGSMPSGYLLSDPVKGAKKFVEICRARTQNKTEVILHCLKKKKWDFFFGAMGEAHGIGHYLWNIHDPTHPDHRPDVLEQVGDPILQVYQEIDRAVGRILDAVDDDMLAIVYLSHGMGPNYNGTFLLDRLLARIEGRRQVPDQVGSVIRLARAAWRRTPPRLRQKLRPVRRNLYNDGFLANRQERKFFEVVGNDRAGGVRINLKGREAHGMVEPGQEYDDLCEMITRELLAVRKVPSGEPLAVRVLKTHEHYSGRELDHLPDLLVEWNREGPIVDVESPTLGHLSRKGLSGARPGDHRPGGRFFAIGPGIEPRQLNERVQPMDFAPTIASILGVELEDADGVPIPAIEEPLRRPAETLLSA